MGYVAQEWMTTVNTAQSVSQPTFIGQAQTFTASKSYNLRAVSLNMGSASVPTAVTIDILNTNPDGSPNAILGSAEQIIGVLSPLLATYYIELASPIALTEGVLYAIAVTAQDTTETTVSANDGGVYSQGANWGYNVNLGEWSLNSGRDLFFETLIINNPPTASTHPVSGNITGDNGMVTIKRAVMAANNKIWYET